MAMRRTYLVWSMTIILLLSLGSISAARADSEAAGSADENSSPPEKKAEARPGYDDFARFLAGRSTPGGCLAGYENKPAWSKYAAAMNRGWESLEARHLKPIRE